MAGRLAFIASTMPEVIRGAPLANLSRARNQLLRPVVCQVRTFTDQNVNTEKQNAQRPDPSQSRREALAGYRGGRYPHRCRRSDEDSFWLDPWKFFDEATNWFGDTATPSRTPERWHPLVDISETENKFTIHAELPGMKKEDVKINVEGDTLTIQGERKLEKSEEDKEKNFRRIERTYGTFLRTFTLPENVNADEIKATYKDGVLELSIPKKEVTPKGGKVITIE